MTRRTRTLKLTLLTCMPVMLAACDPATAADDFDIDVDRKKKKRGAITAPLVPGSTAVPAAATGTKNALDKAATGNVQPGSLTGAGTSRGGFGTTATGSSRSTGG